MLRLGFMVGSMTKPSPELCVCGHDKGRHKMVVRRRDGKDLYCGHCDECDYSGPPYGCSRYRPSLNWPDSEGWWWLISEGIESLCHAKSIEPHAGQNDGVIVVAVFLLDTWRDYRGPNSHDLVCPQFCKQVEKNPYSEYRS